MAQPRLPVPQLMKAALLTAMAILIPIVSPVKIVIPPASFTLLSHLPIFIGMFISPQVAVLVNLGASAGFLLAGFPPEIVARALSQTIFVVIFSIYIKRYKKQISWDNPWKVQGLSFLIGCVHGAGEALAVLFFYLFIAGIPLTSQWIYHSLLGLVMAGTVIHSMFDFMIAFLIARRIQILPPAEYKK